MGSEALNQEAAKDQKPPTAAVDEVKDDSVPAAKDDDSFVAMAVQRLARDRLHGLPRRQRCLRS